jgi:hypothetical protein
MTKRAVPADSESQYVPLPRNITPAGMELNPITEPIEEHIVIHCLPELLFLSYGINRRDQANHEL